LCYGRGLPVETSYMTLSHCWGGLVFLRLLRENIESLQERIPANELSETFKDALEVTNRL